MRLRVTANSTNIFQYFRRRLFLWGNQIRRIENLDALAGLEVLWLNDNQIAVIENIAALKNLKELNLAGNRRAEGARRADVSAMGKCPLWPIAPVKTRNSRARRRIRSLGHSLDPNPGITKLNLSKNLIGSFREIGEGSHRHQVVSIIDIVTRCKRSVIAVIDSPLSSPYLKHPYPAPAANLAHMPNLTHLALADPHW